MSGSHLGTLSDIYCLLSLTSGSLGRGEAEPGCNTSDIRGDQVWGSEWVRGRDTHSQQLLEQVSARHYRRLKRDIEMGLSECGFAHGQTGGHGQEKASWLVLGKQPRTDFGIHSKFSALVANTRLLTKGSLRGGEPAGDPKGFVGSCAWTSAHPIPSTDPRPTYRVPETGPSAGQLCQ